MSEETTKPTSSPSAEPSGAEGAAKPTAAELDSGFVHALRMIDRALGMLEQTLLCLFLLILIGVGAIQAVASQLGTSWIWSFEIIRYSVFFIAMTGAALSAHTEQLISMDLVSRALGARGRARLTIALRLFTAVICVLLIVGGLKLRDAAGEPMYHLIDPRMGLLALPIGAALMGMHVLLHSLVDLVYLLHGRLPPRALADDAQRSGH